MQGINDVSGKATTEYLKQVGKVQQKIDGVPYEKFPFCCSNMSVNYDADLSKVNRPIKRPVQKQQKRLQDNYKD